MSYWFYEIFSWNTICFYETLSVFFLPGEYEDLCFLFAMEHSPCFIRANIFFHSLKFWLFIWRRYISPGKTLDWQCNHGELFFYKAIFIDNFWRPVAFEKLLNFFRLFSFRNCKYWRAFWRVLRLLLNSASLTSIFSFSKSFKYPPNCLEYSHTIEQNKVTLAFFIYLQLSAIV